jgi:hypothetical protein
MNPPSISTNLPEAGFSFTIPRLFSFDTLEIGASNETVWIKFSGANSDSSVTGVGLVVWKIKIDNKTNATLPHATQLKDNFTLLVSY